MPRTPHSSWARELFRALCVAQCAPRQKYTRVANGVKNVLNAPVWTLLVFVCGAGGILRDGRNFRAHQMDIMKAKRNNKSNGNNCTYLTYTWCACVCAYCASKGEEVSEINLPLFGLFFSFFEVFHAMRKQILTIYTRLGGHIITHTQHD